MKLPRICLFFILFTLLMLLPQCGSLPKKEDKKSSDKKLSLAGGKLPTKREPGSLWTSQSRWNRLYSTEWLRLEGDVVFVKSTERLKRIVATKIGKELEAKPKEKNEKRKEPPEMKMAASIEEVLPRGIYKVKVKHLFVINKEQYEVIFYGTIREKDLNENDVISADDMFDIVIEPPLQLPSGQLTQIGKGIDGKPQTKEAARKSANRREKRARKEAEEAKQDKVEEEADKKQDREEAKKEKLEKESEKKKKAEAKKSKEKKADNKKKPKEEEKKKQS